MTRWAARLTGWMAGLSMAGDKPRRYRVDPRLPWIPAPYRGMGECFGRDDRPWGRFLVLRWGASGGIAIDVLARNDGAWIPTAAGMTNGRRVAAGTRRYEIWVCCTIRPDRLQ